MAWSSKTRRLLRMLEESEAPNVTYIEHDAFPIIFDRARGMYIYDVDGKRYLDFNACFGVYALGHRHPALVRAYRKQVSRMPHGMGDVHPSLPKILLLQKLKEVVPLPEAKFFLAQSGAESVDCALKTAVLATKRNQFVAFKGGYHGLLTGPLGLLSRDHFTEGFESWLPGKSIHLDFPQRANESNVLEELERVLKSKLVAGVILEPIQGRGGIRQFPASFLKQARELCSKYGTLLIFDEIFSGFGRTGKLFASELSGVTPDLMCLGKALGGGMPLSVCAGSTLNVWGKSTGESRHTSTFLGHPLACAVALENLKRIQEFVAASGPSQNAIEREWQKWIPKIQSSAQRLQVSVEARGVGWMRGLSFSGSGDLVPKMMQAFLKRGIIILPCGENGDVVNLTPPLISTAKDWRKLLSTVVAVLDEGVR